MTSGDVIQGYRWELTRDDDRAAADLPGIGAPSPLAPTKPTSSGEVNGLLTHHRASADR